MGLIMVVFGIVAKNGILLLDADQKFRRAGMSPRDGIIACGERRLRPTLHYYLAQSLKLVINDDPGYVPTAVSS
jgi:multidrug efflux pump subunit AcrB